MDIKKGRCYRCIKTVIIFNDIQYIKGKIYKSELDHAITDETGLKEHWWCIQRDVEEYFIRVYNKRRRNENSRNSRP